MAAAGRLVHFCFRVDDVVAPLGECLEQLVWRLALRPREPEHVAALLAQQVRALTLRVPLDEQVVDGVVVDLEHGHLNSVHALHVAGDVYE